MIDNQGKIAVIFGLRNELSISFPVAVKLRQSGCRVALCYVPETKDEVLFLAAKYGFETELCGSVDVREESEIADFLQNVYRQAGSIDYILHSVAHGTPNVLNSTYINIPFDELADSFNVSAYSLLRICRVAEPLLSEGASVLALTYNASRRVFPGYAGMGISKAALENIVIYLASYFREKKVRVNAISAGLVMTTSAGGVPGIRKIRKMTKVTAPLGNVDAGDISDTALYYFSALSKRVTGNIHFVDGGFNIMGAGAYDE